MTREAKIGMLTGLGVIVMIGVLLSNYLGDSKTGASGSASASGATGRMADMGVGETYRQQVMQPVGVPSSASAGPRTMQYPGGSEIATPIDGSDRAAPPAAFAIEGQQQVRSTPVVPVPAGAAMDSTSARLDGPPIISLAETTPVKVMGTAPRLAAPAPASYTVAPGDSLGKIAKKFYNSSKSSDIQRIVAANPTTLKDASTMLVVGKKLVIPGIAVAAPADVRSVQPATVYLPGDLGKSAPAADPNRKVQPPIPAIPAKTTFYVVQSGDTLEKISHKLAPTKVSDTMQKLISLNALKDPNNLQVGVKLKVPA